MAITCEDAGGLVLHVGHQVLAATYCTATGVFHARVSRMNYSAEAVLRISPLCFCHSWTQSFEMDFTRSLMYQVPRILHPNLANSLMKAMQTTTDLIPTLCTPPLGLNGKPASQLCNMAAHTCGTCCVAHMCSWAVGGDVSAMFAVPHIWGLRAGTATCNTAWFPGNSAKACVHNQSTCTQLLPHYRERGLHKQRLCTCLCCFIFIQC